MGWVKYSNTLRTKCQNAGAPFSATFELTPFCNFQCDMCYIRLTPEQAQKQGMLLNTEQWIRLAEETKKCGTLALEITGGEPLTRPDFASLYEAFIRMGFLITLRTNGYMINGDRLGLLKKYKPHRVSITIYGASDETYNKICGVKNGFSTVEKSIFALREAGIATRLTVTLTKENIMDKEKIEEWAEKNSFSVAFFGGLFTPIRGARRPIDHLRIDYRSYECSDVSEERNTRIVADREKYTSPFWMCVGFGTQYCISWDGRMTLCNCFPSIWSDALTQDVYSAFRSLYKQLNEIKRPNECATCQYIDYCGSCPARFLSDANDPEKTTDEICAMAKECYRQFMLNSSNINK